MSFIHFAIKSGRRRLIRAAVVTLMLAASTAFSQSIELNSPTPVFSNEIAGRITPLDIGDSRSTRFFYTFNGLQGDLELTVESSNLDGEVDIFLANNLRPLTKVTLYAGTSSNKVAKTVYLRRAGALILRVQARTLNDAEGTYRILLGGAYRPAVRLAGDVAPAPDETIAANPSPAATTTAPARSADRKVKRVSSVGARIEEPAAEVAIKEEPEKSGEPPDLPPVEEKKSSAKARPSRNRDATRETPRTNTTRQDSSTAEADTNSDAAKVEPAKPEATKPERTRPVRVPRARGSRNAGTARRRNAPPPRDAPAPPAPSARLVLVMRDGEKFERDMSGIRRVTVENGTIVIISKNGKVERQSMTAVLRMSIEP